MTGPDDLITWKAQKIVAHIPVSAEFMMDAGWLGPLGDLDDLEQERWRRMWHDRPDRLWFMRLPPPWERPDPPALGLIDPFPGVTRLMVWWNAFVSKRKGTGYSWP